MIDGNTDIISKFYADTQNRKPIRYTSHGIRWKVAKIGKLSQGSKVRKLSFFFLGKFVSFSTNFRNRNNEAVLSKEDLMKNLLIDTQYSITRGKILCLCVYIVESSRELVNDVQYRQ